jgi:hypothetical protein
VALEGPQGVLFLSLFSASLLTNNRRPLAFMRVSGRRVQVGDRPAVRNRMVDPPLALLPCFGSGNTQPTQEQIRHH